MTKEKKIKELLPIYGVTNEDLDDAYLDIDSIYGLSKFSPHEDFVSLSKQELIESIVKHKEQLATLRAESQAKDTRIKELDEDAINFIEWASLHCFNKFVDNHWSWGYKDKYKRITIGWLTTEQLLEEYKQTLKP